jgi:3-phosphoshikimate 1-carboxyvinyltransferase
LILGLLIKSPKKIKIIGDKSLSKRDFSRVTIPLEKFGVKFSYKVKNKLPLTILGTQSAEGIKYLENKGSAQCKSSIMLAALNASGITSIKAKKSRNHTELFFKYLNLPIKVKETKNFDLIEINKVKKINPIKSKFFVSFTFIGKFKYLKKSSV